MRCRLRHYRREVTASHIVDDDAGVEIMSNGTLFLTRVSP